jgi:hypothetical protein
MACARRLIDDKLCLLLRFKRPLWRASIFRFGSESGRPAPMSGISIRVRRASEPTVRRVQDLLQPRLPSTCSPSTPGSCVGVLSLTGPVCRSRPRLRQSEGKVERQNGRTRALSSRPRCKLSPLAGSPGGCPSAFGARAPRIRGLGEGKTGRIESATKAFWSWHLPAGAS